MPRGQKSKLRDQQKRHKAQSEGQGFGGAQASPGPSSLESKGKSQSASAAANPQAPVAALEPSTQGAAHAGPRAKKGQQNGAEGAPCSLKASSSVESSAQDPLNKKASVLMQLVLRKYRSEEPISKGEMLKTINKTYREHFPEILKRTTERMERAFGLELKEEHPNGQFYVLQSKERHPDESTPSGTRQFPRYRLLMPLLGMIFLNGGTATELEDGRRHHVFGEPRRLITHDFVQDKYLEHRLLPGTQPPRYEFHWGPRAYAECEKKKIRELVAGMMGITPSAFMTQYAELLREEQEEVKIKDAPQAVPTVPGKAKV
ncbi:PREDICTED: melanoma-associated antigen B2-like [Elephantulus edwardii]|uniref:melanoma-associated antigen B2-like n=1 Tax=Elephantulus edwardii TaxID=28737 RepID=UPI0003F0BBFA|nr:PREDICTED: melanoma-associated antigen B2-like [Elephantulus edwardii]